jgi:hypothetical protein
LPFVTIPAAPVTPVAIAVTALRLVGADMGVELARDMGLFLVMG